MKNFWEKLKGSAQGRQAILALAPMAGFTDSAFREICRKFGADVVYSEMASVSGLFYNPQKTLDLLKFNKIERPYVVQLFGSNPEHFAKATQIVSKKISALGGSAFGGKPDGIDINMGCPVKKVMNTGAGCALMFDSKLSRQIIETVCNNTALPVSIKIRAGIKKVNTIEFIKKIKDLPFSAVMIHCRTYEQGFFGTPDYSMAAKIKKIIPDKIVLANGGINTAEEAIKILKDYPVIDGLGIARGALGHPWMFEEIKKILEEKCLCEEAERPLQSQDLSYENRDCFSRQGGIAMTDNHNFKKIKSTILTHARLVQKNKGTQGIKEFRAHLSWYIKGFPGASELRRKLVIAKNISEIKKILGNT
jgi:tRNA-dihydrouridine synthase B